MDKQRFSLGKSEIKQALRVFVPLLLLLALVFSTVFIVSRDNTRRDRQLQDKLDAVTAQLTEISSQYSQVSAQLADKDTEITRLTQENNAVAVQLSTIGEQTLTIEEAEKLQAQIELTEKRLGVHGDYYMYLEDNFFLELDESITVDGLFVLGVDGYMRTIGGKEITTEPEKELLNAYRSEYQDVAYDEAHFGREAYPLHIVYFEDGYFLVLLKDGYAAGGYALDSLNSFFKYDTAFMTYVKNLKAWYPRSAYGVQFTKNGGITISTYYEGKDDVAVKLVDVRKGKDEITIIIETQCDGKKESSLWTRTNDSGCILGDRTSERLTLTGAQRHEITVPRYGQPPRNYHTLYFGVSDTTFILSIS